MVPPARAVPSGDPLDLPQVPDGLPWRVVLGIDPGTQVVGYGALVLRAEGPRLLAAGVLRAPRRAAVPERLGFLRRRVDELLDRLRPAVVVVEHAFSGINVQSALRVGEGRGVVLACAACRALEIVQYTPALAKRSLAGNGAAGKEQVASMVARHLGLDGGLRPLDASDALALALTYVHRSRVAGRLEPS